MPLYKQGGLYLASVHDAWYAVGVGFTTFPDVSLGGLQITAPTTIYEGGSISIKYNLGANSHIFGMTSVPVGLYIKPYCQTSGLSFPTAIRVGQVTCQSTRTNYTSLTLPSNITAGQYYLIAKVDYNNAILEPNELNNAMCVNFQVVELPTLPDFVPRWASASPSVVQAGNTFTTSVNHYNQGNGYGDYTFLCYYLSTNTTYSNDDVYLGSSFMGGLNPGSSSTAGSTMTCLLYTSPSPRDS